MTCRACRNHLSDVPEPCGGQSGITCWACATLVRVDNAYESLAKLMGLYASMKPARTGISSLASVSDKAVIGKNVYIGPFAVVEDGAVIGDDTQIYPHVTVGEGAKAGSVTMEIFTPDTIFHVSEDGVTDNVQETVVITESTAATSESKK